MALNIIIIHYLIAQSSSEMLSQKKSKGIIRSRTQQFLLNKQSKRKKASRFAKQNLSGIAEYSSSPMSPSTPSALRAPLNIQLSHMPTMSTLPPQWVEKYQECLNIIESLSELKRVILLQQNRRLSLIKASQQKQSQRKIYDLTIAATKVPEIQKQKIKQCQKLLAQIKRQEPGQSQSDKRTRNNVCMSLAVTIQQKTRQLRNQQRSFIQHRQNIQKSTKVSFLELAAQKSLDPLYSDQLQQQQCLQLQLKLQQQRNEQILKIIQSIHQLNQLYKQLQNLVIVQGSLLDRIDYNIQESVMHVKKADETLGRVDERQRKSKCSCVVIVIMLLAVVVLGIVLIVKWSKK